MTLKAENSVKYFLKSIVSTITSLSDGASASGEIYDEVIITVRFTVLDRLPSTCHEAFKRLEKTLGITLSSHDSTIQGQWPHKDLGTLGVIFSKNDINAGLVNVEAELSIEIESISDLTSSEIDYEARRLLEKLIHLKVKLESDDYYGDEAA